MTTKEKAPVLVVLQLTGGNDYLNTLIPYTDPKYRDYRPGVGIAEDKVLPLDDKIGVHPSMAPIKEMYDQGNVAVIHGVGYANSVRSHFRSMDIWHTAEPIQVATEGWLGRATREMDPNKENVVTTVSFGHILPRALAMPGVPVACVTDLDTYGLLPGITDVEQRAKILDRYRRIYSPAVGTGPTMEYLTQTGLDAAKGADILKVAPEHYSSTVEYAKNQIATELRDIARVHLAGLGTRIFYCDHASFDTHATQLPVHAQLWDEISQGVTDFFDDLREHDAADNVILFMFSEFGRRTQDNGSGTDHGSAGPCFVIGDKVKGGMYSEYPSLAPEKLEQGDLVPNMEFQGLYGTILEKWFGLDATPILNGTFEQPNFL